MSIVGLVSVLLALVAVLLLVLYLFQRRELRAVAALSREVQRVAIGGRLSGRIELQTDQPELAALGTAVNHLLTRVGAQADRERLSPALFADLGDRIHEIVVVHRDVILYANRQFANLVGVEHGASRTSSPPTAPNSSRTACAASSRASRQPTASRSTSSACRAA